MNFFKKKTIFFFGFFVCSINLKIYANIEKFVNELTDSSEWRLRKGNTQFVTNSIGNYMRNVNATASDGEKST